MLRLKCVDALTLLSCQCFRGENRAKADVFVSPKEHTQESFSHSPWATLIPFFCPRSTMSMLLLLLPQFCNNIPFNNNNKNKNNNKKNNLELQLLPSLRNSSLSALPPQDSWIFAVSRVQELAGCRRTPLSGSWDKGCSLWSARGQLPIPPRPCSTGKPIWSAC